jgi:hypothetical protein
VATGAESRTTWGAILLGVLAVAALPVAVFATRYSESYDLLHAGFAIPLGLALGIAAVLAARRARRRQALSLREAEAVRGAGLGWALGVAGIAVAASATVALAVYGVLTYLGERGS